jgi:signal peptidase II
MNKLYRYLLLTFSVLMLDQLVKVLVKTQMYPGQSVALVGDHFRLFFAENNGFAFGMTFSSLLDRWGIHLAEAHGKLLLSLISIAAVAGLGYMLLRFVHHRSPMPVFISLIFGGALGNIIDRTFYGLWFSEINYYPGGLLHGQVVDMFLLDLGGPAFLSPIFNLADVAISVGIFVLLFFQGRFTRQHQAASGLENPLPATDWPTSRIAG